MKGEINELSALLIAISRKEGIESLKIRALRDMREERKTVDKLSSGKFTFRGLFKSSSEKA